jgi:hypothetical protein
MRFSTLLLAEHATITNGLLNILNGGANRLIRPFFPAAMGVALVGMIDLPEDYVNDQQIPLLVVVSSLDDSEMFAHIEGFFASKLVPDFDLRAASSPIVIPLQNVLLSKPGPYKVSASLGGQPSQSLVFEVVHVQPEVSLQPQVTTVA